MTEQAIKEELPFFMGTPNYFRHSYNYEFTEGINFIIKNCGNDALYLVNLIINFQKEKQIKKVDLQYWTLKVNQDLSAVLTATGINDNIIKVHQIEKFDFNLQEIELLFVDNILMFSTEY